MSLINQVLKDLEQRHAAQLVEATHSLDGLAFAPDAANKLGRAHRRVWPLVAVVVGMMAITFAGYWYWQQTVQTPADHASAVPAPVAAQVPPVATQTPASEQPTAPAVTVKPQPAQVKTQTRQAPPASTRPAVTRQAVATPAEEIEAAPVAKQMVPLRSEQKAELSYQSGYQYLQEHQNRRAEQELRNALRVEPGHTKARELLSGLLIKQGRWIEASEILQRGIQISPQHRAFVTLQARTLMQLNRDKQAIALLRDYAPAMHEDPEHYALLAALYQRQADHISAVNTYGQLLKLRPNAGIWWVGMGISLEALGKHAEARQAYQQAQQSGTLHADIARYTDNRLLALESIRYPVD